MVHTDEALEMFKESIRTAEERRGQNHTEMIRGRMPWIATAQASQEAVYWTWRTRTQELKWISDDPINRASYSIYSTNGFHARETEDGQRALLPLECPPPGTKIVADLSALITLHRLDILDIAADYFGEIIIPQAYLATVLEDGKKMTLHQRSRKRTAEEINRHIAAGTIIKIDRQEIIEGSISIVDEYTDNGTHQYHLTDVIQPIYKAGIVDDITYQRVSKICTKLSNEDNKHPALVRLQDILIELSTLETITSFGLLDAISKFYRVYIVSQAQIDIRQRLDALGFQEETMLWHFDLWNRIRNNDRFRFVQHPPPKK